jgi:hypothetical protein
VEYFYSISQIVGYAHKHWKLRLINVTVERALLKKTVTNWKFEANEEAG